MSELAPGLRYLPGYFGRAEQEALRDTLREALRQAPLFTPRMPRTGKPFSVRMSNLGPLGWVSDTGGYRYQPTHPATGAPWPAMPEMLTACWRDVAPDAPPPEACLVNFYDAGARMGLHQDRDEEDRVAPIVSVSLGLPALFLWGGPQRSDRPRKLPLFHGDVVVWGGPARFMFHGVQPVKPGHGPLLGERRWNITFRQVKKRGA